MAIMGVTTPAGGFGMSFNALPGLKGYKPVAAHPDLVFLWVSALCRAGL
jgi:hypothetical protein